MPITSTIPKAVLNGSPNENKRLEASRVELNQGISENYKNEGPKSRGIVKQN